MPMDYSVLMEHIKNQIKKNNNAQKISFKILIFAINIKIMKLYLIIINVRH
jgi:hypothetical protein